MTFVPNVLGRTFIEVDHYDFYTLLTISYVDSLVSSVNIICYEYSLTVGILYLVVGVVRRSGFCFINRSRGLRIEKKCCPSESPTSLTIFQFKRFGLIRFPTFQIFGVVRGQMSLLPSSRVTTRDLSGGMKDSRPRDEKLRL